MLLKPRETAEALKVKGNMDRLASWTDSWGGRECVCVVGLCRPRQETATKMRRA